jgi:hypothetical protein
MTPRLERYVAAAFAAAMASYSAVIPAAAQPLPGTTCGLFPADSVFNADISTLPVNAQSSTWMGNMTQNANLHPDVGTFAQQYGIPINVAPPPTTSVTPTFLYNSDSDHPAEGYPIDQSTLIEGGPGAPTTSDRHALVVNKNLCKLYEIFNLQNFTNGQTPSAGSGAVWDLTSDAMRTAGFTSADAAGLPMAPLLLRPDEILAGSITHAIRLTAHCTINGYIWPGSHQAGSCSTGFPPMGARFRLKSNFNISAFSATTQVVLRAFQHYGLILADNGSDWYFGGTTDDWWGTPAGSAVVSDLKTIPAAQFDAVDESGLQAAAGSYRALSTARALPQDRLHFGLANGPSDLGWMTSSGVPWRYRYQYLSAGVNTGKGWETWNSPTGAFATLYMNASSSNNYLPVFSYYELLQSNPSTGANESDRDFSNLNNASTMNAYYGNFKLLMQLAGSYGKPVVVQVEPDLWGYLQQRAAGGDASTLTASVASSGFADVAGYPNTAQGFGRALLHLRDLYGSNTIMAVHASGWGSGIDVNSSTDPTVNPAAIADSTAAFLMSAGTWDVVFNDLDDHDAGWWETQGAHRWWDPTNATFPNFNRYLAWVAELRAKTGVPQIAWQVPVGNQYFVTMNNTCGHYQDNVAQYFTSHPDALYAAGIIAVLFGAGNACQTTYTDAKADGITNNNGVPTTDTLGYCNACNTHTSVWSDDDGGFLRIAVGQYYSGSVASVTTTPSVLNFSGQAPTTTSGAQTVTLHNNQAVVLNVSTAALTGANAGSYVKGTDTCTGVAVPANGACTVQVSFHPATLGGFPATLTFTDDGPGSPQSVQLSGLGALDNQSLLYTLDGYGGIHANGSSPAMSAGTYWPGWNIARSIALFPDGTGGYVLDGYGGVHPFGSAGPVTGSPYWSGFDIARQVVLAPWATAASPAGWTLDGYGGLHPFGGAPTVSGYPYWGGWDIVRGVAILPDSTPSSVAGYTLDGWGGVHPFGGAPAISNASYWPGNDIARGLTLTPNASKANAAGWSLDAYGSVHPFGSAPVVSASSYWPGWDIARGVVAWTGNNSAGGWVLDGYGGLHPFGGAPAVTAGAYWSGWDIATSLGGPNFGSGSRRRT